MKHLRFALSLLIMLAAGTAWAQSGKVQIQWLGQTSMKVTTPGGKVIVIDPWLTTNPKTPPEYKNLDALGKVDLILVSHGHYDHSADAPALAKKNNVPVYGPAGLMQVWAVSYTHLTLPTIYSV